MAHVLIPNIEQSFEDFLRTVHASNIGLNEECDPDEQTTFSVSSASLKELLV